MAVLLHNVRSAHNVGAIFRTCDAAGVEKIYLTGYTPIPVDRFGRPQKEIAKTALGAEKYVPWEYSKNPAAVMRKVGKRYHVVGVEQDAAARDYRAFVQKRPALFVFGNEVRGLSSPFKSMCDELIYIPMLGKKESLNVATSVGIILFSARR